MTGRVALWTNTIVVSSAKWSEGYESQGITGVTSTREHRRALWRLRRDIRIAVREVWHASLRRRDEDAIRAALYERDWRRYAQLQAAYWRRWR